MIQMILASLQGRNRDTDVENKHMDTKEGNIVAGGRGKSGAWDEHIHTTIYKIDNQQAHTV